jgi:hypothetical protein
MVKNEGVCSWHTRRLSNMCWDCGGECVENMFFVELDTWRCRSHSDDTFLCVTCGRTFAGMHRGDPLYEDEMICANCRLMIVDRDEWRSSLHSRVRCRHRKIALWCASCNSPYLCIHARYLDCNECESTYIDFINAQIQAEDIFWCARCERYIDINSKCQTETEFTMCELCNRRKIGDTDWEDPKNESSCKNYDILVKERYPEYFCIHSLFISGPCSLCERYRQPTPSPIEVIVTLDFSNYLEEHMDSMSSQGKAFIEARFKDIIYSTRSTDIRHNRYDRINHIDRRYLRALYWRYLVDGFRCAYCDVVMDVIRNPARSRCMATIERADNTIGHIKANCLLCCYDCNTRQVGQRIYKLTLEQVPRWA